MQKHTYAILDRVEATHWWFRGRRAILESFLRRLMRQRSALTTEAAQILDLGCGTGGNMSMLGQFGQVQGIDVSTEALEFARTRGHAVCQGSANSLPFPSATLDLVAAFDVIEHLDDDVGALREMNRVLRPGGVLLGMVPAFMWLWGVQDDVSEHKIRYTRSQIMDRLRAAGFVVERASFANFTFFLPILAGRMLMRVLPWKPESENNVNVSALNGVFAAIFSSEKYWLRWFGFPIGVSLIVVARRPEGAQ